MLDSIWDLFWYTLVVFAFVAYLLILFQVLTDLFRDRTMSSVARILWIIGLILLPYLTAFAYLLTRGRGIAERNRESHEEAKQAADAYIRDVAGRSGAAQIADAKALLDAGTISQAEFDQLKAKALA
ncbi:SHOCT domain-containing protein [Rhodococcus spelaei]|uniref:SHOCT domain-containing protein n=1 Tax=Rhodococcus spelaei TaxID=2546320 RepID=A0A541B9V7_9NOCA|nr:SHOCT domain-containing protein [Rhodococcus spelaei]TQF69018.1 SHOCT domain-containing protein [Rhodococcus spelaei]